MKPRTKKSMELYRLMLRQGYPEPFCEEVTRNLNTDWTAQRMIGYLLQNNPPERSGESSGTSRCRRLRLEDVADEVLAILSDRNRIMAKKETEAANERWNRMTWNGFPGSEDE